MGKTLLHVGGSALQLPSIRWAREAGLRVCVTDANPTAPGRKLADEFRVLDGTDVEGLVALGHELQKREGLAGAYCSNDFGLPAVAAIGAATGTPANAPESVARALDKTAAAEAFRAAGLPTPAGRGVDSAEELARLVDELEPPLIVKPVDSSGSRGVRSVRTPGEAAEAFAGARRHGSRVRVECTVSGEHLDVNGFFREGAFVPAGILERFFTPDPLHVPTWGAQPKRLAAEEAAQVYGLVERAARALGIEVGPVKADVIRGSGGPVILELAPRFHGDVSTAFVTPLAHGRSPIQAWFATLADAGGPFDDMPLAHETCAGWMAILPEAPGVLAGVHGIEAARALDGVERVLLTRAPGHVIETLDDNTGVCGFLWATASDEAELRARLLAARSLLHVTCETGVPWRAAV